VCVSLLESSIVTTILALKSGYYLDGESIATGCDLVATPSMVACT
jgi:hypothetical protein